MAIKNVASNGKNVGKMIKSVLVNASAACYIGQNGLYQPNGKANEKNMKNNNKEYSTSKKRM